MNDKERIKAYWIWSRDSSMSKSERQFCEAQLVKIEEEIDQDMYEELKAISLKYNITIKYSR